MADCSQTLLSARAECTNSECGWSTEAKNAMGNAAQHADAEGHEVSLEFHYLGVAKPEGLS